MILPVFLALVATAAPGGTLAVRITALHSNDGQVGCVLWVSGDGFPSKVERALQRTWCGISNKAATCHFEGVPEGDLAVSCFHDENGNQKCDTNFLGIPKEGVAVSRDAKGFMGPPKYKNAKLVYPACGTAISVTMHYF